MIASPFKASTEIEREENAFKKKKRQTIFDIFKPSRDEINCTRWEDFEWKFLSEKFMEIIIFLRL